MLKNLTTEFKVGLFSILAVAGIVYMFFVLNPGSFDSTDYKKFYTLVQDASGLIPKSQVKTNGVVIGQVISVELESNKTRITMMVRADVKVPKGSKIEIRTRGLLGDAFLEILRADDSGQYLQEGDYIPRSEDNADLNAVMGTVGSIAKDIKKISENLATVLGGDRGLQTIDGVVKNVLKITEDLRGILEDNRPDVRNLIVNLEKTSNTLRKSIGEREKDVQDIVSNINATTAELRKFSKSLNEVLNDENKEKLDRIVAAFDDSMIEVKGATKNINLISDKINRGEGTIGKLVNDDKTLVEIEGAVRDIREAVAGINKLQVEVDYHGEARKDSTTAHYFNLHFRTRPDKYYLVGFTDRDVDTEDKTTEVMENGVTDDGHPRTRTVETTKKQRALRFNLQFAKKWEFIGVRFGLFESTGGIATDLYAWHDRIRIAIEAFDWKSKNNPDRQVVHLKSYASILFFNHISLLFGVDDILRKDAKTGKRAELNYFVGGGLTFTDDDIKSIFGAAALAK